MKKDMNNQELATLLKAISAALEVKNANRFRVMAYDRAAVAVEHATSEIKDLWDDNQLMSVPGIGTKIAQHLDELFRKGKVSHFEKLMKGLPPAMFPLLKVSGIGPKTAFKLCHQLKLKNSKTVIKDLAKAARQGKIASLKGFGKKSEADILTALKDYQRGQIKKKRMLLPYADAIAQEYITYLKKCPQALKIDFLGSLRRRVATVGDIDLAVSTREPKLVIDWFVKFPQVEKIIEKGVNKASVWLKNGHQVDLRVQMPQAYGSMIQYFIGSKHHNIHLRELALKKGLSLSEYGIKKFKSKKLKIQKFADEKKFYQAIGLPWIPPEIREDNGEIEAAQAGKLPRLLKLEEIKGDLHTHSDFSLETSHDNGVSSMAVMGEEAKKLGYQYLGFSEHNPSLSQHSEKQIINLLKKKKTAIDKLNYSFNKGVQKIKKVHFINGLEVDIRPNGSLALPQKGFDLLDFVIASIHSSFRLPRKRMTARVLRALSFPKVRILGHPTGRKLGQREGYELDWEKIFAFCLKKKIALEINAQPERLDLPDALVREAVKRGVKMVINSDSHAVEQMKLMKYGLFVAQRGWAEKQDIINTLTYGKITKWLKGGD